MGLIESLHAEIADTEAAIAQLQQESLGHADLLASYFDQVTHHPSLMMTLSTRYGAQALPKGSIAHCAMFCLFQANYQNMHILHCLHCFEELSPVFAPRMRWAKPSPELVFAVLMSMPEYHLSLCFVCPDDSAAESAQ